LTQAALDAYADALTPPTVIGNISGITGAVCRARGRSSAINDAHTGVFVTVGLLARISPV
jgi:hypothetical protein